MPVAADRVQSVSVLTDESLDAHGGDVRGGGGQVDMQHAAVAEGDAAGFRRPADFVDEGQELFRGRLENEIGTAVRRSGNIPFRLQPQIVPGGERPKKTLEQGPFVGRAIHGDPQLAQCAGGQQVDAVVPEHPRALEQFGNGALECNGIARQMQESGDGAVRSEPQDVIDGAAEAVPGVQQEAEKVVAGRRFDDPLSDPDHMAVGEPPVHAEDIVAVWTEAGGSGGERGGRELLAERDMIVEQQRETLVVRPGLCANVGGGGVCGDADDAVDGIVERREAAGGVGQRGVHGANRLSAKTFSGLSWCRGLKTAGTASCRRVVSGPKTRGI